MESVTWAVDGDSVALDVLNAFRHHGIGHLSFLALLTEKFIVLNAFRHHGIGHTVSFFNCCEFFTVLNAFRHHGIGHAESCISS